MSYTETQVKARLKELFAEYGDLGTDAYDKLNIAQKPSRGVIKRYIGGWKDVKYFIYGKSEQPETKPETPPELSFLISENTSLRNALDKQKNINQVIIEQCFGAISKCSFRPAHVPHPERSRKPQEFHAMRSDDQIGEVVDTDWTQGVGGYDFELFKRRNGIWAERVISFREQDKASLGLNKLIIYMLGDHVDGELIYKGQAFNIEFGVIDQLIQGVSEYVNTILALAEAFPIVEVFCVPGNHGRHGKKGEGHPRSNFDYLFARMVQEALRRQENVKVYVSECPTMIIQNGNFTFALNHFDTVNAWNGIPYYGLDRMARRLGDLYKLIINYKLGGHFHISASLNDDEIIINGTIVGGSDLSINKMQIASRPSQKIFYFDREHGIHRMSNLHLSESPRLVPDVNGIYTAVTA